MDAIRLAEMADIALANGQSELANAAEWRTLVRSSIQRRAREIAADPRTETVREDGILVKKVAEWTDQYGIRRYVVYFRDMNIKSVALVPHGKSGSFKRETHQLHSSKLLAKHLRQHFEPLMT